MNRIDLHRRVAVITGAAQGIGFAIATRLAASGAALALWDQDAEALAAAKERLTQPANPSDAQSVTAISTHHVDVTDYAAVVKATEAALANHNRIDILVANAGIAGPNLKTWEYPLDAWHQVLDINLNGVFHCCRAILPHMLTQNYGRIVNIASIAGKEGNPNASAYSASKAAVIALTKSLGKETADRNIAVNCVTPAAARTRLFDQMTQQHVDYMLARIPRGRFLEVDEAAAMIAWLVSEENSFTTAAVFDLSGGRATY